MEETTGSEAVMTHALILILDSAVIGGMRMTFHELDGIVDEWSHIVM